MVFVRNYEQDKDKLKSFIEEFYEDSGDSKNFIYKNQILNISKREQIAIYIQLDDVNEYDQDLSEAIEKDGLRYQRLICFAIDELIHQHGGETINKDAFDIFIDHRMQMEQNVRENVDGVSQPLTIEELRSKFPPELLRRYEAYFVARKSSKSMSIRNILSNSIGHIVKLKAIVTRATQVKPLMKIATYSCDRCGSETYQEILNKSFLPLLNCLNEVCKSGAPGRLHLQTKGSKHIKLQELRIQEVSDQVPIGKIPRSMLVHCKGENTRLVQPGDYVFITGVFLPMANSGARSLSNGLTMELFLDTHSIIRISKDDEDDVNDITAPSEEDIEKLKDPEMYSLMAKSIAPEIFGHEDIKKALLIMMVGGTNISSCGTKIRGNLNICLMGDPGVAKSQLLGFVDRLSPRSQYTTGTGASGVGLTATVVKDQLTGEMTLEAGSLVLADGGVCCIDEFDKMAESDRTSIHEVMEQQTVSIAKAGIMTTLNARVSILAAANPAYGRYNPRRTIEQNIDLPAALLSRFDLLWLIQDRPHRDNDLRLAQHITYVHTNNEAPETTNDITLFSMSDLRRYLAIIRKQPDPTIPQNLVNYLVGAYVSIRKESKIGTKESTFTSARSLLALLRISTALARIRLQTQVDKTDVDEAIRLFESSKASVTSCKNQEKSKVGFKELIYQAIRRLATDNTSVRMADIERKCVSMGFTPDQINEVIDNYEELNVWQVNVGRTKIVMVN